MGFSKKRTSLGEIDTNQIRKRYWLMNDSGKIKAGTLNHLSHENKFEDFSMDSQHMNETYKKM